MRIVTHLDFRWALDFYLNFSHSPSCQQLVLFLLQILIIFNGKLHYFNDVIVDVSKSRDF